jgi:hypothetical protein
MVESALRQQKKNLKPCPVLVDHYRQPISLPDGKIKSLWIKGLITS